MAPLKAWAPLLIGMFLAGCAAPPQEAAMDPPSRSSVGDAEAESSIEADEAAASELIPAAPSPVYLNGTLTSVHLEAIGVCNVPTLKAFEVVHAIPAEAWNRSYEGPTTVAGTLDAGAYCPLWWFGYEGPIEGAEAGKVPYGAFEVHVRAYSKADVAYSIRIA